MYESVWGLRSDRFVATRSFPPLVANQCAFLTIGLGFCALSWQSQVVGPIVFRNCAGFIRIRGPYANINLLDDTRVHPQNLDYAQQIVWDALGTTENSSPEHFVI